MCRRHKESCRAAIATTIEGRVETLVIVANMEDERWQYRERLCAGEEIKCCARWYTDNIGVR